MIEGICKSTKEGANVFARGRVMSLRNLGGSLFFDLRDEHAKIQVFAKKNQVDNFASVSALTVGSIVEVSGETFFTQAGEYTIRANQINIIVVPSRCLPVGKRTDDAEFHVMSDLSNRYRNRHLDLWSNLDTRDVFRFRSNFLMSLRNYLHNLNFVEFDMATLERYPSGAVARTFDTHCNALNSDMHLRISLEIPLKKMIIGGFERVFEIGKVFRNEGVSTKHNPEFTLLELYVAYASLDDMKNTLIDIVKITNPDVAKEIEDAPEVNFGSESNHGWEWIVNHPANISPLAKSREDGTAYRFELAYNGVEVANAYWEQNNPDDQKGAFLEQRPEDADGLMYESDESFIEAMEYGMPPCAGMGIGIDRLIMILNNLPSIRDTIVFPVLN